MPYKIEVIDASGKRSVEPREENVVHFSSTLAIWEYFKKRLSGEAGGSDKIRADLLIYGLSGLALKPSSSDINSIEEFINSIEKCGIEKARSFLHGVIARHVRERNASVKIVVLPMALTQTLRFNEKTVIASLRSGGRAFELAKTAAIASLVSELAAILLKAPKDGRILFVADTTHGVNYATMAFYEAVRESVAISYLLSSIQLREATPRLDLYVHNSDPVQPPILSKEGSAAYKIHLIYEWRLEGKPLGLAQSLALQALKNSGCNCGVADCIVQRLESQLGKLFKKESNTVFSKKEAIELAYMLSSLAGGVLPWALYYALRLSSSLPMLRNVSDIAGLVEEISKKYRNYSLKASSGKESFISFSIETQSPEESWALISLYLAITLLKIAENCNLKLERETLRIPLECLSKYSYLLSEPAKELLEHEVHALRKYTESLEKGACKNDWGKEDPDLRVFQAHAGLPARLVKACKDSKGDVYVSFEENKRVASFLDEKLKRVIERREQ